MASESLREYYKYDVFAFLLGFDNSAAKFPIGNGHNRINRAGSRSAGTFKKLDNAGQKLVVAVVCFCDVF